MNFIPQFEPLYDEREKKAVQDYLDSGGWLTEFQETRNLEKQLADYIGSRYCWMIANGTVSLTAALYALGLTQKTDEVVVPNFTMVASPNSVLLAGATPILVDVDRSTLCLTPETIEPYLTPRTKAVMHVSINGRSGDMVRLKEFCDRKGLVLIEDAAQALGSRWKGRHLGTFGAVGSYSFSMPKIITMGQGGALVTDDEALMQRIQKIRDFGRVRGGIDEYTMIGFNFKFSDLQAVFGIEQMKKMPERVARKKEMFQKYQVGLKEVPEVEWLETDLSDVTPWFMDVFVPDPVALANFLKEKGIGTRPMYPALHTQAPYNEQALDDKNYPVSLWVAQHGLWLPSSLKVTDEQIQDICAAIRSFYAS